MRNLWLPSLLHPVWPVRKRRQERTRCNFSPLAAPVWSLSSVQLCRRDRDAGEPRVISGQLLPLQEKGWRDPVLRAGWETVQREPKHEWTCGDITRCGEWRWHGQQMFYLQVVRATSEFAGGEVWSLCEQHVCLQGRQADTAVTWIIKCCSAPFCLAQPHRSLKSAERYFICPGKYFLRPFQWLTTLAVKSGWSVFSWTQASRLAVNLMWSHAFHPDVLKIIQCWPSLAILSQLLDINMFLFFIENVWAEVCAFYIVYVKIIHGCFMVHLILKWYLIWNFNFTPWSKSFASP